MVSGHPKKSFYCRGKYNWNKLTISEDAIQRNLSDDNICSKIPIIHSLTCSSSTFMLTWVATRVTLHYHTWAHISPTAKASLHVKA